MIVKYFKRINHGSVKLSETKDIYLQITKTIADIKPQSEMIMITKERRKCVRSDTSIPVEFIVQERFHFGSIKNICGSGSFVDTTQSFSVGQDVSLTYLNGSDQENRTGQVVRITSHGIGVKYNFPGYYENAD